MYILNVQEPRLHLMHKFKNHLLLGKKKTSLIRRLRCSLALKPIGAIEIYSRHLGPVSHLTLHRCLTGTMRSQCITSIIKYIDFYTFFLQTSNIEA